MKKNAAILLSLLILGSALSAQSADEFTQKARQGYHQKQFVQAAALYEKAFAAGSTDADAAYDAACCYALIGGRDKAFEFLKKAGGLGWSNADHARKDTDLESLRTDPRWEPALALFDKNAKYAQVMWASPCWNIPYAEDLPEDVKIAGLSRFWSEVKYNFAFPQKLTALDWDALYLGSIPRIRATRSTVEYYEVLQELCAKLQDGHTNILMPNEYWKTRVGRLGLQTRLVEGRVLVNRIPAKMRLIRNPTIDSNTSRAGKVVFSSISRTPPIANRVSLLMIAPLLVASRVIINMRITIVSRKRQLAITPNTSRCRNG